MALLPGPPTRGLIANHMGTLISQRDVPSPLSAKHPKVSSVLPWYSLNRRSHPRRLEKIWGLRESSLLLLWRVQWL